jgi:radical SAM protein (TIGR01212 family)
MQPRYNAYGRFLRERFGCRVYKVSIDGGFTCPNRDGSLSAEGCTYCNNDSFRPKNASRLRPVSEQLREGMDYLRRRFGARKFIAYFPPFPNTYAPFDTLAPLYEAAMAHPDVVGVALGPRPDCIDEAKLAWLETLARTRFVTVEYGLQSVYDETLLRINRGHDFDCWRRAVAGTRGRGIWIGAHLILGFPWETREAVLAEADILSGEGVNFLKLHHLHVVRGTALAREYAARPFPLPSLGEYAELVADFLERLSPDIHIERLFGTAPERELFAPVWGVGRAGIQRSIERTLAYRGSRQGMRRASPARGS